ncbi:MAG: DEAD/DEAH box helicase, partial [bacterium]
SKSDLSLKIMLHDYWRSGKAAKQRQAKDFGKDIEKNVLLNLGQAARMYPKIWEGLETDKPSAVSLDLGEAFEFLKEFSWILEDAGFKVAIPAWWTPKGRRKAKIRIRAAGKSADGSPAAAGSGIFGYQSIVQYQYALSIGGETISQQEWQELVNAKTPLVQFRGEWMELDRAKMEEMLKFWQAHGDEQPEMSLLDLMKVAADEEAYEFDHDDALAEMFATLRDKSRYEPLDEPPHFSGELREYQKRGLSWIHYLETLGLGGCLADDMGLGKTVQVIARLLHERATTNNVLPTLLVAPTSVLGNWQKEIERFAPNLRSVIHHGSNRSKDASEFAENIAQADVVISSYSLARRDEKIFCSREWQRVVLDEAQNIKNPKAAQSKSILKFKAQKRLALTGTPVENRLMDLWSIVNFLNRGYLGTAAGFRKAFEIPVQRDNDPAQAKILKNRVEPLILRRLKTDKAIIKDLPDKVEQKVYCHLTKEQASLYEAVVKDVVEQVEESEGIQRRGIILASLMKLKQVCNHPAQFLQDGSDFSRERSHKLSRLLEMIEEAVESGESVLIFSQFKEICAELDD